MKTYATFLVNDHILVLLDEAASRRAFRVEQPGLLQQIASAASAVKTAFGAPAEYSSILPTLQDYPYRI